LGSAKVAAASAFYWLALAIAIAASQAGQLLLKLGAIGLPPEANPALSILEQLLRWQTLVGLCCYGTGTLFYAVALRRIPMSVALPCTAVSYVSATLFGMALFGEALNGLHLVGLAMVCAGVVLLADIGGETMPAAASLPTPSPDCATDWQERRQ
jgi:small multidrug resistance pump